jgi:hypothetical protein
MWGESEADAFVDEALAAGVVPCAVVGAPCADVAGGAGCFHPVEPVTDHGFHVVMVSRCATPASPSHAKPRRAKPRRALTASPSHAPPGRASPSPDCRATTRPDLP